MQKMHILNQYEGINDKIWVPISHAGLTLPPPLSAREEMH